MTKYHTLNHQDFFLLLLQHLGGALLGVLGALVDLWHDERSVTNESGPTVIPYSSE